MDSSTSRSPIMDCFSIFCAVAETCRLPAMFCISKVETFANYGHNRRALVNELQKLTAQKNAIQESVEYDRREGKSPTFVAKRWLDDVEEAEHDARDLLDKIPERAPQVCRIRRRYCQSMHMAGICETVKKLISSCDFQVTLHSRRSPVWAVEKKPTACLHGQEVASKMLSQLVEFLKDGRVNKIAVWGMGGVGKTTLVKNLNNNFECLLTESFDIVVWVTVPRNSDLREVQCQIAERLNLEFDAGESIQGRANRLHRRLMKMSKSLLILDDVLEKFDLEQVGIPEGKCKILLTTRSYDICRDMMTDKEIKVDLLSEESSWSLFAEIAGEVVVVEKNIETVARAICRRCCGLPLALKAVAKSMRNKKMIEQWKDTLCQLKRGLPFPLMMEIFLPLKLSYDYLPSDTHRLCFLYCSLFPENFSIGITELIDCWIADELIDRHRNLEESHNNGVALIENLKDSCMLEHGDWPGTVKMHDLWRDLALWICSNEKKIGFFCWFDEHPLKFLHSFQRISLMKSNANELPSELSYCKLRILLLQDNPLREIPERFFHEAKALRYLNLSSTHISSLPLTSFHSNCLHSLLLKNCQFLEKIPSLGSLRNLELLDLSGTRLRELPTELGRLVKLKTLKLSRTYLFETIQPGTLSGVCNLEVLDMSYSGYKWGLRSEKSVFDELLMLERLSVLQIRVENFECLAAEVNWIMQLRNFKILVSPMNFCEPKSSILHHDEKRVIIRGLELVLERGLEMLLCKATALELITFRGVGDTSDLFGWRILCGLRNLKSISITRCDWITNILSGEKIMTKVLPNLEHLSLTHLENLVTIFDGAVPNGCFRKLRSIQVANCPRLKNLISHALLCQIRNLEELKVRNCSEIKCIFSGKVSAHSLPSLRVMQMRNLISLKLICHGTSEWPGLDKIEVFNCRKLRRLPFSFLGGCSVREIRGDLEWWNNLAWPDESTKATLLEKFQVFIPTPLRSQEYEDSSSIDASEVNLPPRSCSQVWT